MMKFNIFVIMMLLFTWTMAEQQIEPNWESINARPYPQWFSDAKLGIFIHWGVSSVPSFTGREGYAEWFLRGLQLESPLVTQFQKRVFGEDFTYRDYAPLFKAELFNADEWAELFKKSGAGYVLFVSKHHDGYALWPSQYSPGWNAMEVGPKRNIVGELTEAVRKAGLKMGLYYSLTEWNNELHRWYTDPPDSIHEYVEKHMVPQFRELVSAYRPSIIFTDGEWWNKASDFRATELISWYYNLVGPEAIVNNRWGSGSNTGYLTPEYSAGIDIKDRPWAEVRGLGRSFGLNRNEPLENYMTSQELIHLLVECVAYGGGLTINVGPKADGQIPLLQQKRLMDLGKWLNVNGEAIYQSKAWTKSAELKDYHMERIDGEINFNWVRNTPGGKIACDDFQATWTGFIQPEKTDNYRFTAKADDGMRLWIDDKLVIDHWETAENDADGNVMGNDQSTLKEGAIRLKRTQRYPIRIEYFENKQNAGITLYWESKNREKEIVPASVFFTERDENRQGLKARYTSQGEHICYTTRDGNLYAIVLEWPDENLVLEIDAPREGTRISLLGTGLALPWKYEKGRLLVDVSGIKYNDMPGHDAWTFKLENYLK
ncbi:MAG: alpha-L-fucosidase [Candidatus Marinimicrobia bacterium]|nr:alpha-L-fucosidase [Candidatus Neomarinimicrobiota bacterium]